MARHLVRMSGIAVLAVSCTIYPFLPGPHDSFAMALSTMSQVLGLLGLLFVPVGGVWLVHEARKRASRVSDARWEARGHLFAIACIVVSSVIGLALSLAALALIGLSFGLLTLALSLCIVGKLMASRKRPEDQGFHATPLYLVILPVTLLLLQLSLAAPLTEFSRNLAIARSADLLQDIEAYHAREGRYPSSLAAVHDDYEPSVVGVEKFHYAPNGDGYDVFFEQPRFLLDDIGIREFVVYNKRDEQFLASHDAWILSSTPEELWRNQGAYAVQDAQSPYWKRFLFD